MRSNLLLWMLTFVHTRPWPFYSRGIVQGVLEGYINIPPTVVTLELFHAASCLLQYCRSFQQRTGWAICSGAFAICPAPCQWRLEQPLRRFSLEVTISPNLATNYALQNIVPAGMALSRAHTSDKSVRRCRKILLLLYKRRVTHIIPCGVWRYTCLTVTLNLPQHYPNVTWSGLPPTSNTSSVAHVSPFHRILWKLVKWFLRNPVNKQTNAAENALTEVIVIRNFQ